MFNYLYEGRRHRKKNVMFLFSIYRYINLSYCKKIYIFDIILCHNHKFIQSRKKISCRSWENVEAISKAISKSSHKSIQWISNSSGISSLCLQTEEVTDRETRGLERFGSWGQRRSIRRLGHMTAQSAPCILDKIINKTWKGNAGNLSRPTVRGCWAPKGEGGGWLWW